MCIFTSRNVTVKDTVVATWEFFAPTSADRTQYLPSLSERGAAVLALPEKPMWQAVAYRNAVNAGPGPGMMLLLVYPKKPIRDEDIIALVSGDHDFIDDMLDPFLPKVRRQQLTPDFTTRSMGLSAGTRVVERGDYSVVVAERPTAIHEVIDRVRTNRRPNLDGTSELFKFIEKSAPGATLILACYNGSVKARTFMVKFEPRYPGLLIAPGLDQHGPGAPQLEQLVHRDHWLLCGSPHLKDIVGKRIYYDNRVRHDLRPILPSRMVAKRMLSRTKNGDFIVNRQRLLEGSSDLPIQFGLPSLS